MFPAAYFITWSCYGARLHGDSRGSVDRDHNAYNTPLLPASEPAQSRDRRQMPEEPFVLSAEGQRIVRETVAAHTEYRRWELLIVNVRTNHVHLVVSARLAPESVMGQYKAWTSRRLREAGVLGNRTKVWTPHGSTKYLWTIEDTRDAVHYARNLQ